MKKTPKSKVKKKGKKEKPLFVNGSFEEVMKLAATPVKKKG